MSTLGQVALAQLSARTAVQPQRVAAIISGCATALTFAAFTCTGGIGWDGDSINSGVQFLGLFKHGWYDTFVDTAPKTLMMVGVGLSIILTKSTLLMFALGIGLMVWMFTELCQWVKREGGYWWLALAALTFNQYYYWVVRTCDNPAFSLPLAAIGLSYYFQRQRISAAALLLLGSALFRPGAEMILLCLTVMKARRHLRGALVLGACTAIGVFNTAYSHLLITPHLERFIDYIYTMTPQYAHPGHKYSIFALQPLLQSLFELLKGRNALVFLPFAAMGILHACRSISSIKGLFLLSLGTYSVVAADFLHGVAVPAPNYVLEFSVIYFTFCGFAKNRLFDWIEANWTSHKVAAALLIPLLASASYTGHRLRGAEVRPDGQAVLPWYRSDRASAVLRSSFSPQDRPSVYSGCIRPPAYTFFLIDNWPRLGPLRVDDYPCGAVNYRLASQSDIILLPDSPIDLARLPGFTLVRLEHHDVMLVRRQPPSHPPPQFVQAGLYFTQTYLRQNSWGVPPAAGQRLGTHAPGSLHFADQG